MKAAYVNTETEIVENVIIVNSIDDPVPNGYRLVEIPLLSIALSDEEQTIVDILKDVDPDYQAIPTTAERPVHIGITKWNETQGFYGDDDAIPS